DAYYSISALGDMAFLTTFKNTQGGKGGDIVRIKLIDDSPKPDSTTLAQNPAQLGGGDKNPADDLSRPGAVAMLSGKVIDQKTGKPIAARITYQTLPDGAEAGETTSDPTTGEYKIILPYGQKYTMRAIAPDFIAEGENVDLTGGPADKKKGLQEIKGQELKLIPIEIGRSVRLNNIFFDTGKSILRDESAPELDRMVVVMNENPKLAVELGGHTDNTGSNEINAKLSQDRADAVREYLIGKGIEPDRIASKGYGETKPVSTNDTDAGRQQNRRVEFVITKK
ncbi:MAG TPA: OmpA family protein, partial [Fibrella sp.]